MKNSLAILLTLVLTACGGGGGGSTANTAPGSPVTSSIRKVTDVSNYNTVYTEAVGDLNNDGLEDVVVAGWAYDSVTSYIWIFIQNTDGTLIDRTSTYLTSNTTQGAQHVFIADMDGDGRADIVVPGFGDGSTVYARESYIFWNTPGQHFTRQTIGSTTAHGACIDDVNSDGRPDLIESGFNGGGVFLNQGNRQFTLNTSLLQGNTYFSTCSVVHHPNGNVSILLGNNGGDHIYTLDQNLNYVSDVTVAKSNSEDLIDSISVDINLDGVKDLVLIYNATLPDTPARKVFLNVNGNFVYSNTIDTLGNDYYTYTTTVNSVPAIYFAGNTGGNRLYTITANGLVAHKPTAFADMAIQVLTTTTGAQGGAVYHGSNGKMYIMQLLNTSFHTMELQ